MIATINSELKGADVETLGLLLEVLQKSKQGFSKPLQKLSDAMPHSANQKTALSQQLKFIGENLPFEAIEKLSIKERGALQRSLKEQNKEWLREKFTTLNALWVMVLDGQVKAWGKNMKDYPQPEQIMEVCQNTGKYPFIFIDDDRMAIEEVSSVWHELDADDYYPTVPVILKSDSGTANLVADFDTGSPFTFVSYDLLLGAQVVQRRSGEYVEDAIHLGKAYQCVAKTVYVEMSAVSQKTRTFVTTVYCVDDWGGSPFVKINPNRTALIGRNLPLDLELNVLLQFGKRRTEIIASTSKQNKGKKKKPYGGT
ncbi:hypothetical protein L0337_07190 [candidate division KSB1 bacterium]|nr:hypothetical protein [candidate division KSB1 bacterium]